MAVIIDLTERRSKARDADDTPRGPAEIMLYTGVTRVYAEAIDPSPEPAPASGARRKRRKAS
jgi:hypothetical protein